MTDHLKALTDVAKTLHEAHAARDRAIITAHNAGTPVTHIANAVGLSRAQVHRIINAASNK